MPNSNLALTDDEGTFLALLIRSQPATAYQLSKVYEESPVTNFGTSKGKVYPLIRRLSERGHIARRSIPGDARGSELLECTRRGRDAVRTWVKQIRPAHLLLEDPLRTKVQSFDLLSREEQLAWVAQSKAALKKKLIDLEFYGASVTVPYKEQVHDNAVSSIESRLAWLDRLEASIEGAIPSRAAKRGTTKRTL